MSETTTNTSGACELVLDYVYGELDEARKKSFEEHLPTCASCTYRRPEVPPIGTAWGPGRPRTVRDEQVEKVVVDTLEAAPPDGGRRTRPRLRRLPRQCRHRNLAWARADSWVVPFIP